MSTQADRELKQFLEDRNQALTAWVMNDDFSAVVSYCLNYGVGFPDDIDVLKLGMYKAALGVTNLPKEVHETAKKKIEAFYAKLTEKYG